MKVNSFPYVTRLYDNHENIIGSGFLTSRERLVTASHVVFDSLDTLDQPEPNWLQVHFDLPMIAPGKKYCAQMAFQPQDAEKRVRADQSDFIDDFVVLETTGALPETNYQFAIQPASSLVGNRFWTYGFLDKYSDGMDITGEILGPGIPGILQLQGDNPVRYFVQRGFSGSPVWDEELGAVVAMIVAAEIGGKQFAIAISLDIILKKHPILAKDALASLRCTYQRNRCQSAQPPRLEVASPLDDVWERFHALLPWHEQIASPLRRIRYFAANFDDLDFLAFQIGNLRLDSSYERLMLDIRQLLDQADEQNVFGILRAHKKRLEKSTGLKAAQVRKLEHPDAQETELLQIDAIQKNISDLRELIRAAEFQRCFCITGGLGSGKTYFLNRAQAWVGNDPAKADEQFILFLDLPDERLDFGQLLLDSFDRYFEITFPTLDALHQHFQSLNQALQELKERARAAQRLRFRRVDDIFDDERFDKVDSTNDAFDGDEQDIPWARKQAEQDAQIPRLSSMPPPAHIQLIPAIDDIARWSLRYRQMIPTWIKTFKEWTAYPEILWIATMPLNSYPDLVTYSGKEQEIWLHYGVLKNLKVPNIGGWIAMDNLNLQEETGLLLIQETAPSVDSDIQVDWLMNEVENREHLKRILCNPFNAWALIETLPGMQVHSIIDLNFIDFVHKFRDREFRTVLANDKNLLREEPLKEIHLHQFVSLIADCLPQHSGEHAVPKGILLRDVVQRAEAAGYDFTDKQRADFALFLLSAGSLLEVREIIGPVPDEVVEILFEPFWHYSMACKFANDHPGVPESTWVLENRLSRYRRDQLPGILEFYMLLVSQQIRSAEDCLAIFKQVLKSRSLPKSAVWYAGAKSAPAVQAALIPTLEQVVQQTAQQQTDPESLYALMYCIGELSYSQISFSQFVHLLQVLCPRIKEAGLEQFYVFLIEQALGVVQVPNDIVAAMPYFTGCEVFDVRQTSKADDFYDEKWEGYPAYSITAEVAQLTIDRLKELVRQKHEEDDQTEDGNRDIIRLLLEYLHQIRKEFPLKSSLPQREKHWKRQLFREWALYHFLGDFVDEEETAAYDLLIEQHWYEHPDLHLNKLLALHMEQEANIAFGRLMWTGRRYQLIELVSDLSASDNEIDRRNAFHIIRHTVPTSGGSLRGNIDEELHPILRDLYLDDALGDLASVGIFEEVFKQLEDFNRLKKTRDARASKAGGRNKKKRDGNRHRENKKNKRSRGTK